MGLQRPSHKDKDMDYQDTTSENSGRRKPSLATMIQWEAARRRQRSASDVECADELDAADAADQHRDGDATSPPPDASPTGHHNKRASTPHS